MLNSSDFVRSTRVSNFEEVSSLSQIRLSKTFIRVRLVKHNENSNSYYFEVSISGLELFVRTQIVFALEGVVSPSSMVSCHVESIH